MFIQTLRGLTVALMVVGSVIVLVDFVEQTRAIGTRIDVSTFQLLWLTMLKTPSLLEATLPFVMLFGVLSALFSLSRRSELIVMRSSGMSAWRILAAPMVLSLLIGALSATVLNPLGAAGNAAFERQRDALMDIRRDPNQANPVWLRETNQLGFTVIAAQALEEDSRQLRSPSFLFYSLNETGASKFDRRIDAASAILQDGYWELEDAVEHTLDNPALSVGVATIPTSINRQALFERSRSAEGLSVWDLPSLITSAEEAGLATEKYQLRYHSLLVFPLSLLASTLIAAAATLRLHRLGGAAAFAVAGGIAGFITYFFQELLGSFGTTGALPPLTAAWTAPILTALLALIYIASTEDG
jgi:lipopolysaccharide export system permease protein